MSPDPETETRAESAADSGGRRSGEVTVRLLNAAVGVFGQKGYEGARVSEIARNCGLTTGAIYARWPNKHELFLAVIEHVVPQRLIHEINKSDKPAAEKMMLLLESLLSVEYDEVQQLMIEACVIARRDTNLGSDVARVLVAEGDGHVKIVAEGKAAGVIDSSLSTDAIVLTTLALSLGIQLARSSYFDDQRMPSAEEWNALYGRYIAATAPPLSGDSATAS